ncbi:MAG: hypothetical protein AAF182_03715 [Pseudomonadota bacterium]
MSYLNKTQHQTKKISPRRVFFAVCALAIGFAVLAVATKDAHAVRVSLKRVVFDESKRSEILTIINNSSEPKTYRLGWKKYRMDENEALKAIEEGEDDSGILWADNMVRYAPRRITVAPGGTQQVRLLLRRPKDMQEGEYRSHLWIVTEGKPDAFNPDPSSQARQIRLEVQPAISLPIFVRQGELNVETSISDISAKRNSNGLTVGFTLNRTGNRSIYGDVDFVCTDIDTVIHQVKGIAVYRETARRNMDFEVPGTTDALACSNLKVVYRADPNDRDFPSEVLAEAPTVIN